MTNTFGADSPTILLRISQGTRRLIRAFDDFAQAQRSAEAFARAGFVVEMVSATGRSLMDFEPLAASLGA